MKKSWIIFFLLTFVLYGKISLVISADMTDFLERKKNILNILDITTVSTEEEVKKYYVKQKVKLAIIRSDVLRELYSSGDYKQNPYHIIGKVTARSMLYFARKSKRQVPFEEVFRHHRFSIGLLGNSADRYLKPILKQKNLLYSMNFVSMDLYRSVAMIKKEEIDGFFLFAPERYRKVFSDYLSPYPRGVRHALKAHRELECDENAYCYASYYLIASDTLGNKVMENLYIKLEPLLEKDKQLVSNLGKYYIYTGSVITQLKQNDTPVEKKSKIKQKTDDFNTPKFHRAPWMDIAIREAIKGKGSAENVLPMLDLSYKYIRFAKGSSGITTAPNDNREGSWCAAYICWTLNQSGYKVHKNGRMASQSFRYFNNKLYRKIDEPVFGAITLYTNIKKPTHGHVGYLFGKMKNGRYIILGGNQNNRLKFSSYPIQFGSYRLKGFYVPIDYKITEKDRLTEKDIYPSAAKLNRKYGIIAGKGNHKVR